MKECHQAVSCADLLADYAQSRQAASLSAKFRFEGVGERDVYNIAAPFTSGGEEILTGRVESRTTE